MVLNRNLLFQPSIFRCELLVSGKRSCLFGTNKLQTLPQSPSTPGGYGQSTWILVNSNEQGSLRSKARELRDFERQPGGNKTTTEMAVKCLGRKDTKENMAISG